LRVEIRAQHLIRGTEWAICVCPPAVNHPPAGLRFERSSSGPTTHNVFYYSSNNNNNIVHGIFHRVNAYIMRFLFCLFFFLVRVISNVWHRQTREKYFNHHHCYFNCQTVLFGCCWNALRRHNNNTIIYCIAVPRVCRRVE